MAPDLQQQAAAECPWELLDSATLALIVAFMHDFKDLASLQRVNKELHLIVSMNMVWLPLLASKFGLHLQASIVAGIGKKRGRLGARVHVARAQISDAARLWVAALAGCMPIRRTMKPSRLRASPSV
jgi:hypothetical protein